MHATFYLQHFLVEERVALTEAVTLGRESCARFTRCVWMTFFLLRSGHWNLCEHITQTTKCWKHGNHLTTSGKPEHQITFASNKTSKKEVQLSSYNHPQNDGVFKCPFMLTTTLFFPSRDITNLCQTGPKVPLDKSLLSALHKVKWTRLAALH